ncbi:hypothetical protein J6590_037208 [Homalodisca vitripennis]|nr:hypothetical protein J6590_037208 [Homalodisca vitripennis]
MDRRGYSEVKERCGAVYGNSKCTLSLSLNSTSNEAPPLLSPPFSLYKSRSVTQCPPSIHNVLSPVAIHVKSTYTMIVAQVHFETINKTREFVLCSRKISKLIEAAKVVPVFNKNGLSECRTNCLYRTQEQYKGEELSQQAISLSVTSHRGRALLVVTKPQHEEINYSILAQWMSVVGIEKLWIERLQTFVTVKTNFKQALIRTAHREERCRVEHELSLPIMDTQ